MCLVYSLSMYLYLNFENNGIWRSQIWYLGWTIKKVRHPYAFIETDIISNIHTLFQEISQMIHIIKTYNMHPITECPVDGKFASFLEHFAVQMLFPGPGNRMTNSSSTLLLARHRRTVLNKRKGSLMPGT